MCTTFLLRSFNNPLFYNIYPLNRCMKFVRYLCNSKIQLSKIYIDNENMHAHKVLEQSLNTYQIFSTHNETNYNIQLTDRILNFVQGNDQKDYLELFQDFKTIAYHCNRTNTFLSNECFNNFVRRFCDIIYLFNNEQLFELLQLLSILPKEINVRAANFVELWNMVDIECCRRLPDWNTDQLLLICDAWYKLNLARISDFVSEALRKLGRKIPKMTASQLVQTMFLCNIMRKTFLEMIEFEVNLSKCANQMSIGELGVMSMGFFKTQTPIRNEKLLNYLYQRLIDELPIVDDITFAAILKVLRYSSRLPQVDIMMKLLNQIYVSNKLNGISLLTCLHIALLGCELQCSHDKLIECVLLRFDRELDSTRIKDLERIVLVIALFNIKTDCKIEDNLCKKILESLKGRIDEILKYPRSFTTCLHFLTLRNLYDAEMLSAALDQKFLKHATGTNVVICREFFHLDTFVKVNLNNTDYVGSQLKDKNRNIMGKMLTNYIPERSQKYTLSATDNILLEIKEATNYILSHAVFKHVLPNYERPDIVVCYDREQQISLPISSECPSDYSGVILTPEHLIGKKDDIIDRDTIVIVVAGWNNILRNHNRHTGLFDMKLKQLELLGHKYITIYWHDWRVLETHADRTDFLRRRLLTVTNKLKTS